MVSSGQTGSAPHRRSKILKSCNRPVDRVSIQSQCSCGQTYSIGGEQTCSTRNGTYVPTALDKIDSVYVVCIYDTSTTKSAHNLSKDVDGNLAPGEITESSEGNGDCRVDVTSRNTARYPNAECRP